MSKKCYLDVLADTEIAPSTGTICEKEIYWEVADKITDSNLMFTHYLLQFSSLNKRKRFIHEYTMDKRVLGKNSIRVKKFSHWVNDDGSAIPAGRMKPIGMKEE